RSTSSRDSPRRRRATCRNRPEPPSPEHSSHRRHHMSVATVPAIAIAAPDHKTSPWPVFWVASVAAFLVSLDSTMLYAAFGALRAGFPEASAAQMSWVLNAY